MRCHFFAAASFCTTSAILFLAAFAASPAAHADVKIVSEVTITNGNDGAGNAAKNDAQHFTVTTSYKGRRARLEKSDGTVIIYDRADDKVYTFAPDHKTYYVRSFSETFKAGTELPSPLKDRMKLDSDVKLDAIKSGDAVETRAIANQEAGRYSFLASVRTEPKTENEGGGFRAGGGGGGRGGRGGHGGGFPGGGGGFPGGGAGMPPGGGQGGARGGGRGTGQGGGESFSIGGELWAADAEKLLPTGKKDEKEMLLALAEQLLPASSPALDSVSSQLAKKHLLPLSARLVQSAPITTRSARSAPQNSAPAQTSLAQKAQIIEMRVASLDTKTDLPDTLFQLPEGVDRVEPPVPAFPNPGNNGNGGPPPP